jgi:hypothetical protein
VRERCRHGVVYLYLSGYSYVRVRSPCCTTQTLSLHDNSLVGTIPDFSGALNLTYVDLHNNALTVCVSLWWSCGGSHPQQ